MRCLSFKEIRNFLKRILARQKRIGVMELPDSKENTRLYSVSFSILEALFGRPLRLAGTRALLGADARFIEIHLLPTLFGSWRISKASMPAICYQMRHRSVVSASRQGLGLSALFKSFHMSFVTQFTFILAGYTLGAKRCNVKRCTCLCLLIKSDCQGRR